MKLKQDYETAKKLFERNKKLSKRLIVKTTPEETDSVPASETEEETPASETSNVYGDKVMPLTGTLFAPSL